MPPPTVSDSWLHDREFGIVIDAGSSGSRLQIYSWKNPYAARASASQQELHALPVVEKGTKSADDWQIKAEPGISTFGPNPDGVAKYLEPLLSHAKDQIPPSLHGSTPIFLLATAGMRLLPTSQQDDVLSATCDYIRAHSNFRMDFKGSGSSKLTGCGRSVRIISGVEEGLFGWIAVNYLMNGFALRHEDHDRPTTFGFLDMGGASTQIAFEPSLSYSKEDAALSSDNVKEVRLRLLNGEVIQHRVFVTTWLGFGTNQARERYVKLAIKEHEPGAHDPDSHDKRDHHHRYTSGSSTIYDPCLPKDLILRDNIHHDSRTTSTTLHGTGSYSQCLAKTSLLLNKHAPCSRHPCLFDGVHVPPIDFSHSRFIGVSEYWYSSQHVFGLGGAFDFEKYEEAAEAFCSRDWDDILKQHQESGTPKASTTWGKEVDVSRLEMQCFKAAWIVNVLNEGIGMPRTPQAWNETSAESTTDLKVEDDKAKKLGLDKGEVPNPIFQSMDTIGGTAISWTLGKMVLEASKEVPPPVHGSSKDSSPIIDPMIGDSNTKTPSEPKGGLGGFFGLDSLENRLPHKLQRGALGFSPILFLFYLIILSIIAYFLFKLRFRIRGSFRRWRRSSVRRDRERDSFINEDGVSGANGSVFTDSPPGTPTATGFPSASRSTFRMFISTIQKLISSSPIKRSNSSHYLPPYLSSAPSRPFSRQGRQSSLPSAPGSPRMHTNGVSLPSLASAPSKLAPPDEPGLLPPTPSTAVFANVSLSGLQSRNSSSVNLTNLVPRSGSSSRVVSGAQTPMGGASGMRTPIVFDDDG
ncbi:Golgi apyrase [Tulasnella sp. 418]|nr:Golgi apyrase [Tulasnella sp. 418]